MAQSSKKSNLPDLDEVMGIASKLFNDLRKSIGEVIDNYKAKRGPEKKHKPKTTPPTKHETKSKH